MYWTTQKETDSFLWIDASAAVDDIIYSFTGSSRSEEPIFIHVLNTYTLEWSLLPNPVGINGERLEPPDVPIEREFHTVVAYDKKIYLWGGLNFNVENLVSNTLYCFDTETLKWSRPQVTGIIPSPQFDHSACISNHLMYIFGGLELNTRQHTCDVYCLNLKTMNWGLIKTTGEKIPSLRTIPPTLVNNRIYIFGGREYKDEYGIEEYNDTMYLDLESNRWHRPETTGKKPDFKMYHSIFVHNNIIYIFSGRNFGGLNDLYYFDTERNHWNLTKPRGISPKLRELQSCVAIGDKMFCLCSIRLVSKDEDEDEEPSSLDSEDGEPSSLHSEDEELSSLDSDDEEPSSLDSEDEEPSSLDSDDEDEDEDELRYRNTINVLDFNPSLKILGIIAIIENRLDSSVLPNKLRSAIDSMRQDLAHI